MCVSLSKNCICDSVNVPVTGAAGPRGPAGPQGATGADGGTGPPGATGPQGSLGNVLLFTLIHLYTRSVIVYFDLDFLIKTHFTVFWDSILTHQHQLFYSLYSVVRPTVLKLTQQNNDSALLQRIETAHLPHRKSSLFPF